MLLNQLEKFGLTDIYPILKKEGITDSEVWTLNEDEAKSAGLTIMQRRRYFKAVAAIAKRGMF